MELSQKVRQALLKDWDPIGIQKVPECQDEYDRYVEPVCSILRSSKNLEQELFEHLWELETDHMALKGSELETRAFAQRLLKLKI